MSGSGKIHLLSSDGRADILTAVGLPDEIAKLRVQEGPVVWVQAPVLPSVIQALEDMGLDEVALKSLRDGPERPRVEEFPDHIYISLFSAERTVLQSHRQTPAAPPLAGEECTVECSMPVLNELRIFIGDHWIISVGDVDERDYEVLAERMKRQVFSRNRGPSFVAYHICEWLIESLQPALEELDDRIDDLEDEVVMNTRQAPMRELFNLKKDLVDLRRQVSPVRDVMQRLGSHGVLYIEPEAEVYFRDVHDDVMRMIELLDTYRDILSSALDLHLSSVSNRLNVVMKQLTVVATLFMPLSFLVGLFGTNFVRMPYSSTLWFVIMFVLMAASLIAMMIYSWKKA